MPYIVRNRRNKMFLDNCGDLNYQISILLKTYIQNKGESYQTYNDILGALEGAKLELYRRKVAPYETLKIMKNGDI